MFEDFHLPKLARTMTRFLVMSLVIMLTVTVALPYSDLALAQGPDEGGLVFVANTYANTNVTIYTQETVLGGAYFGSHGSSNGLEITPDGLRLAPGAGGGTYTSDPIASPLGVTTDLAPAWQATLPAGASIKVETRLSPDGLAWSSWAENPETFYPVRNDEHAGTMVWIGSNGPVQSQLRFTLSAPSPAQSPILHHLALVFSDASHGPTDVEIAGTMPSFSIDANICPAERPPVVSRTVWGSPDGQDSPRWSPQTTEVTHIITHHSATPSSFEEWNRLSPSYQIDDWAAVVRAIWNYHANTLWWGDIGYNYLIAPDGTIYEGRAGNQNGELDIKAAHDGKNRNSLGLGFIGCYGNCSDLGLENADPFFRGKPDEQQMMNLGVELMAWKLGQKGLNPQGSALYHGQTVPRIAGGRDVTWTHSPGDRLYNEGLPWLRDAVFDRVQCEPPVIPQCQITEIAFEGTPYAANDPINLVVRVAADQGNPLGGATVTANVSILESANASGNHDLELIDKTGNYEGTYTDTAAAGLYSFTVTATHPNFDSCSASASVEVGDSSPPGDTVVRFTPSSLEIRLDGGSQSMNVEVAEVDNLQGFSFEAEFDPQVVNVLDANPDQDGVQIEIGEQFSNMSPFVALNVVTQTETVGLINLAVTWTGQSAFSGSATMATITWTPSVPGSAELPAASDVTLAKVKLSDPDGMPISHSRQHGVVTVTPLTSGSVSGQVYLQGRSNHHGITIRDGRGQQTQTNADGSFTISSHDVLTVEYPGYLSAQADVQALLTQANSGNNVRISNLGSITLLAGDVNGDNLIDIFDLAYLANRYNSTDPGADLNGDGIVDIFDLAMTANNYDRRGPLTRWQ